MRVAYFSPLLPERSGIADYSALLLPALRERVEVTIAKPRRSPSADVALYHLGNNPEAHGWIYEALQRRPGLVVLHEVSLHALIAGLTLGRGQRARYLAAVERDAGSAGRAAAERALERLEPPLWETHPLEIPLLAEALDHATGVIVHSGFAERKVREQGYDRPIHRIAFAAPAGSPPAPIGLPSRRRPVIGSLGKLNFAKRIPQLLLAFSRLRKSYPDALLVLAGEGTSSDAVRARLDVLGLEAGSDVLLLDYVSVSDFRAVAATCDVCANLRYPTLGETSGSAIAALAAGTPLVVSDVGWFSELPGAVAAKVPVDEWEVDHLAAVLELICSDDRLRAGMEKAALEYALTELDLARSADAYAAALHAAAPAEALAEAPVVTADGT
jgi:glycosyltransferase involved in cell wall biosynthesis